MRHQNLNIIVTGGTAYIGSNLVKKLVSLNYNVNLIVREQSDLKLLNELLSKINLNIHNGTTKHMLEIISNIKPDIIIHLASYQIGYHETEDVEKILNSNILFGTQLLEAACKNKVKYFINTGTYWQYLNSKEENFNSLYAASKNAFNVFLQYYSKSKLIKSVNLILYDVYGPNDPRPKLLNLMKKSDNIGKEIDLTKGEQNIDFVHIKDTIAAYLIAVEGLLRSKFSGQYNEFLIKSGKKTKLKDLLFFVN